MTILIEPTAIPSRCIQDGRLSELWLGSGDHQDDDRAVGTGRRERPDRTVPQVLIVEDETFIAWHLEDLVRGMDLEVCALAARGEDAVRMVAELAPDLVLMDINLAGQMDGIEAARRMTAGRRIPVVFITAYSDRLTMDDIEHAAPGSIVLQKPITAEALRAAVAAALAPPRN